MNISVLGAGGWGTTLAILLHSNEHEVTLWEYERDYVTEVSQSRYNEKYLPGIKIPDEILITNDLEASVKEKELIVLAIPSQFLRNVLTGIDPALFNNTILLSVAKGIENNSLMTMSQMLKTIIPSLKNGQLAVLSGPSHAEEVARQIPTAVVAASGDKKTAEIIQNVFMTPYFRVYTSSDIVGVEMGGAFKNVIAIGAGIIDGAKFGDNTKAAIMTRGIAEISRLGIKLGAKPETFAGLSGMGDLIVTCMSRHSRNRFVGEQIGAGKKLKEVLKSMKMVAEGVQTTKSVVELAKNCKVETPIACEVYNILFEEKDPSAATYDLMTRDMKTE